MVERASFLKPALRGRSRDVGRTRVQEKLVLSSTTKPGLRGPAGGSPALLNPAAHALQHAAADAAGASPACPPMFSGAAGDAASVGYHLRHLIGALDRLLTYARGESLTPAQLQAMAAEAEPGDPAPSAEHLLSM